MNEGMKIKTYKMDGEFVHVQIERALLVFTYREWVIALKRGKSVLRAHSHATRARDERETNAL
jgi:hypothetical protein